MAVNLFELEVDPEALSQFQDKFRRTTDKHVDTFLNRVKAIWQQELYRQQFDFSNGRWAPYSDRYAKRKEADFAAGKIEFTSMLKRHGSMLKGYVQGVKIDPHDKKLTIDYPRGTDSEGYNTRIRAKSHQGVIRRPKGVNKRPFDLDRFNQLAVDVFLDELSKS